MDAPPRRRWPLLVAARLPYYLGVPLSLLAFPSLLPWVLLLWIATFAVQLFRRRPGASISAFIAVALLLVKRMDSGPSMVALASLLLLGATPWPRRWIERQSSARAISVAATLLLLAAWGWAAGSWHADVHRSAPLPLRDGRPLVVVGDSLTVHGWPGILANELSVPLIDRSEGGINTVEGLARVSDALALRPQLVVIELGGHDYLEKRGRDATEANLREIIRRVRGADADVLLFEIPRGFVVDPFRGLERQLAREHDLELVTDGAIRQLVLFSPFTPLGSLTGRKLSDDGLHPNAAGHRFLADRVKESLVRLYGSTVLAAAR